METGKIVVGALILAVSSGLTACGGSGAGRSSASGLSRSELAAKANAICAVAISHGPSKMLPAGFSDNSAASFAAIYDKTIPVIDEQTKALGALTPAAGAAHDWRAFVTAEVAVDRLFHRERAALSRSTGLGAEKVRPLRDVVVTATKIGATTCVSG